MTAATNFHKWDGLPVVAASSITAVAVTPPVRPGPDFPGPDLKTFIQYTYSMEAHYIYKSKKKTPTK
jgi:hypothetical protein